MHIQIRVITHVPLSRPETNAITQFTAIFSSIMNERKFADFEQFLTILHQPSSKGFELVYGCQRKNKCQTLITLRNDPQLLSYDLFIMKSNPNFADYGAVDVEVNNVICSMIEPLRAKRDSAGKELTEVERTLVEFWHGEVDIIPQQVGGCSLGSSGIL